jgi:hypothetical protein
VSGVASFNDTPLPNVSAAAARTALATMPHITHRATTAATDRMDL